MRFPSVSTSNTVHMGIAKVRDTEQQAATPQSGNKNALTTGEHETITPEDLTQDEVEHLASISDEPHSLMKYLLDSAIIRDQRMAKLSQSISGELQNPSSKSINDVRVRKLTRKKGDTATSIEEETITHAEANINRYMNIEEGRTRVQKNIINAINSLHKYGIENERLLLEQQKLSKDPSDNEITSDLEMASIDLSKLSEGELMQLEELINKLPIK